MKYRQRGRVAKPAPSVFGCNRHHVDVARLRSVFGPAPSCRGGNVLGALQQKEDPVGRHGRIGEEFPARTGFVPSAQCSLDQGNPARFVTGPVCPQLVAIGDDERRKFIQRAFHEEELQLAWIGPDTISPPCDRPHEQPKQASSARSVEGAFHPFVQSGSRSGEHEDESSSPVSCPALRMRRFEQTPFSKHPRRIFDRGEGQVGSLGDVQQAVSPIRQVQHPQPRHQL